MWRCAYDSGMGILWGKHMSGYDGTLSLWYNLTFFVVLGS